MCVRFLNAPVLSLRHHTNVKVSAGFSASCTSLLLRSRLKFRLQPRPGQSTHVGEKHCPSSGPIPCSVLCFRCPLLAGLCLLSTRLKEISLGLSEASAHFLNFQCKLEIQQTSSEENLQFYISPEYLKKQKE